jgi:hypothetical protein
MPSHTHCKFFIAMHPPPDYFTSVINFVKHKRKHQLQVRPRSRLLMRMKIAKSTPEKRTNPVLSAIYVQWIQSL